MTRSITGNGSGLLLASLLLGIPVPNHSEAQVQAEDTCSHYSEARQAFFGDLHVHSSYSADSYFRMGSRTTPDDAYRFALGQSIPLPPFDAEGNSARFLSIDRPLDFAAVTDHAEDLADVRLCSDPSWGESGSLSCGLDGMWKAFYDMAAAKFRDKSSCQAEEGVCVEAKKSVWQDTIQSAEAYNKPCEFTAFVGYEWSATQNGANMHRNVIFRNSEVVHTPISANDATTAEQLWQGLDTNCRNTGKGCDAITIPHNMNLSKGMMFSPLMGNGELMTPEVAAQRQSYETLAEIMQHKGDSECFYGSGLGEDELCNFEKLPYSSFLGKYVEFMRKPPANDTRYMREALREGLRQEQLHGINPFKTGFIGGTDTHITAPGAVEESNYAGHHGDQNFSKELPVEKQLPDFVESGPGGLAVVYAEQNTRESLFAAMKRREAYGTTGPRIGVRFFGGENIPQDACSFDAETLAKQGYQHGVPMGGDLRLESTDASPRFVVLAQADSGTLKNPGTPLQRLQIIKGWVDAEGRSQEKVMDVAGNPDNGASVDLATCESQGVGFQKLCAVWDDPMFNSKQQAYYYARVVENPSCRWNAHVCMNNQVDCSNPESVPEHLQSCCDASVPKTLQERAWTSPIWYSPR
ncbi:DUF3604 domain-containing protein [Maricurvus nonylphenolicus]|uniref:DUF3604 domain-containing protein n=1 Tax=Maricurvus nonylphenolicus TaxID=1008307 RepID=UPI0036F3D3A2